MRTYDWYWRQSGNRTITLRPNIMHWLHYTYNFHHIIILKVNSLKQSTWVILSFTILISKTFIPYNCWFITSNIYITANRTLGIGGGWTRRQISHAAPPPAPDQGLYINHPCDTLKYQWIWKIFFYLVMLSQGATFDLPTSQSVNVAFFGPPYWIIISWGRFRTNGIWDIDYWILRVRLPYVYSIYIVTGIATCMPILYQ